jgi:hypothetical protein
VIFFVAFGTHTYAKHGFSINSVIEERADKIANGIWEAKSSQIIELTRTEAINKMFKGTMSCYEHISKQQAAGAGMMDWVPDLTGKNGRLVEENNKLAMRMCLREAGQWWY